MQRRNPDRSFDWIRRRLDEADQLGMRRRLVPRELDGPYLVEGDRRLINFGGNDYLGIAMESSGVGAAAKPEGSTQATPQPPTASAHPGERRLGSGSAASPLVCGFTPLHARLCEELAALEQVESAVLFPSGFAACSGVVAALAEAGDLVLSDSLNHASLIDGCRLSKATRFIYPHRDHRAVAALLTAHRKRFARVFIITDSVFSMDGTRAPLVELADLADAYDATLIVDEAHATGVLGHRGAGLCELLGVEDRIPIRIGTLSKAIGAHGGFVVGPRVVIDYLLQQSRPLIYSTAAPPTTITAALRGLRIIREEPERRNRVLDLSRRVVEQLNRGQRRVVDHGTPIIPVVLGEAGVTLAASERLAEAGFYVPAIRPPTVPPNMSRLRISLSAAHTDEMITALCGALQPSAS